MKVISYSLFGYGKERQKNSFDFNSYLRGVMVNARINRIIYPDWITLLNIDSPTLEGQYSYIFKWLEDKGYIKIQIHESEIPLCKAMLWRVSPCFIIENNEIKYDRVICRDLDSVCTYREAQAVKEWENEGKILHCITDSISHNIPMLGGMVGFQSGYFMDMMERRSFNDFLVSDPDIDFNIKGTDQKFLNKYVYPKLCDSATEHFCKGMSWNKPEENGRHYSINENIEIPVDPKFKELNLVCGHIGAAGYYDVQMVRFLNESDPYKDDYKNIEERFSNIFYWRS